MRTINYSHQETGSVVNEFKRDIPLMGDQDTLEEINVVVRKHSIAMRNAMAENNLKDVIKESSGLIGELRTSALTLSNYSELYSSVTNELQHLYVFFLNMSFKAVKLIHLYDLVQQAGNIIPRLYLVIVVGVVCVVRKQLPCHVFLNECSDLCKGVQHPLRGLFLRHYLLKMSKHILAPPNNLAASNLNNVLQNNTTESDCQQEPSTKHPDEGKGFSVNKEGIFEFLCSNYVNSLKLWKRFVYYNTSAKYYFQKNQVQFITTFISSNLTCMVETQCITPLFFRDVALKRIMEPLLSGRDSSLQQYLVEYIVDVFPEECHIEAILSFMTLVTQMSTKVDISEIFRKLIIKLEKYLENLMLNTKGLKESSCSALHHRDHAMTPSEDMKNERTDGQTGVYLETTLESDDSVQSLTKTVGVEDNDAKNETGDINKTAAIYSTEYRTSSPNSTFDEDKLVESLSVLVINESHERCSQEKYQSLNKSDSCYQCEGKTEEKKTHEDNSEENFHLKMKSKAAYVFDQIKKGFIEVIRLAHNANFRSSSESNAGNRSMMQQGSENSSSFTIMSRLNIFRLLETFLHFTMTLFPQELEMINTIYQLVSPVLLSFQDHQKNSTEASLPKLSTDSDEQVVMANLLSAPIKTMKTLDIFNVPIYVSLIKELNDQNKCYVFHSICHILVDLDMTVEAISHLELIFSLGNTISLNTQQLHQMETEKNSFETELCLAKLIHLVSSSDIDAHYTLLTLTWNNLVCQRPDSYPFILPSFISKMLMFFFKVLNMNTISAVYRRQEEKEEENSNQETTHEQPSDRVQNSLSTIGHDALPEDNSSSSPEVVQKKEKEESQDQLEDTSICVTPKQILQLVYSGCMTLMKNNAEMGYYMILTAAEAIGVANSQHPGEYADILTEFLRQALVCYEEYFTENKSHVRALAPLVALLVSQSSSLEVATMDLMAEALTRHGARLLRTSEQCVAILQCAHLFWNEHHKEKCNIARIRECLEKSLKLVVGSLQYSLADVSVLIEVLSTYLYFFERSSDTVPAATLSHLISLCGEQLHYALETSTGNPLCEGNVIEAFNHFKNILIHIENGKKSKDTIYQDICLPDFPNTKEFSN